MLTRVAIACVLTALAASTTYGAGSDLNLVVILDNSGSMNERMRGGGSRIDAAKRSLLTVLEQTPEAAQVGVVLLNPPRIGDDWLIRLGPVDRAQVERAVTGIRAGGPTPLGGAMKLAADSLLARREDQRYGVYKLLVVTDGEATDKALLRRYLPEVQARGVQLDVIGVDMGQQHSLAQRADTYRNAADPASLEKAISEVVLGESGGDGGDAAEEDFELLAAIPGELAAASLTALSQTTNEPIGEGSQTGAELLSDLGIQAPAAPPATPAVPNPPGDDGGGFTGGLVFAFFAALILFNVLTKLAKK